MEMIKGAGWPASLWSLVPLTPEAEYPLMRTTGRAGVRDWNCEDVVIGQGG